MRSHTGVNRLEYSGKRIVRAESRRRSIVHACQATRLRTGCTPSTSPMDSSRTSTTTASANETPTTSVAGISQASAPGIASAIDRSAADALCQEHAACRDGEERQQTEHRR